MSTKLPEAPLPSPSPSPEQPGSKESWWTGRRRALVGTIAAFSLVAAGYGAKEAFSGKGGSAENPAPSPDTSSSAKPGTEIIPTPAAVDPSAKLEPLNEKVDTSTMPLLVTGNFLKLPQPGTPEEEVQQYCNVIAGAISSDRPDLLRQAYGDTAGEALDNDELIYSQYKEQVEKIQSQYPATKPLLSLKCSEVSLDPQEFVNGSHKVRFAISGSLVSNDGRLYAKSLWDKSNIAEDRLLTLNRDGFTITDDGTEIKGIKAEFSELVD